MIYHIEFSTRFHRLRGTPMRETSVEPMRVKADQNEMNQGV